MSVYFTSDLHLGHLMASDKRGFNDIRVHDETVLASIEVIDDKRMVLYILGDVAMNPAMLSRLKDFKCRKILVRGNHDVYKLSEYLEVFEEIHGFLKYKGMWLSHCPIHPQEMFRAEVNVHGHIHKDAMTKPLGFPYINVNWDFWHRPISLDEVKALIESRSDGLCTS